MARRRRSSRKQASSLARIRSADRERKRVLIAACLAASLALVAFLVVLRHRRPLPAPKPTKPTAATISDAERTRIAGRLRQVVEHVGGDEVWVKGPPYAPFPPRRPETAAETVVAKPRFDPVLAAVEQQAADLGLQSQTQVSHPRNGWRLAEVRLLRDRALAGLWLVREVPRIRHAAIVIDDLGQDLHAARQAIKMPYPLTFAVLPHLPHSSATAEEAHHAGREVMLHLPMEPNSAAEPGPGEIRMGMSAAEVGRLIDADLSSVPHAAGVNNHMGSRATTNARLMTEVIDALLERHLFFIDSRTTAQSVALEVARRRGIPSFYRSVFLDDVETVPYTVGQLRKFLRVVEDQDAALAIGHPHPTTLAALERYLPEFERHDIELVAASQLLRLPVVAQLGPAEGNR